MVWTATFDKKDVSQIRNSFAVKRRQLLKVAETPGDLVRQGQYFARAIAPNMTGTLIKAIKFDAPEKSEASLYIDTNTLQTNPNTTPLNKRFNYAQYMHEHDGKMGRGIMIKSGDPRFMVSTRDFLMKEFNKKVKIILGGYEK